MSEVKHVSPEQIANVRHIGALSFLLAHDSADLIRKGNGIYRSHNHSSLEFSNGKWHYWKTGAGGVSALDYLIKVEGYSLPEAVTLLEQGGYAPMPQVAAIMDRKPFVLPPAAPNNKAVETYLLSRGIDKAIIDWCIASGSVYQSDVVRNNHVFHNAVFVGCTPDGTEAHAALRGTNRHVQFRGDHAGSDKRYTFGVPALPESNTVMVFESAIDLLSHATIEKMNGQNWRAINRMTLSGAAVVSAKNKDNKLPAALEQYLTDNPRTDTIWFGLDNDEAGRSVTEQAKGILERRGYTVTDRPPPTGKDYNDYLKAVKEKHMNLESGARQAPLLHNGR